MASTSPRFPGEKQETGHSFFWQQRVWWGLGSHSAMVFIGCRLVKSFSKSRVVVVCIYDPSYLRDGSRRIAWVQEFEAGLDNIASYLSLKQNTKTKTNKKVKGQTQERAQNVPFQNAGTDLSWGTESQRAFPQDSQVCYSQSLRSTNVTYYLFSFRTSCLVLSLLVSQCYSTYASSFK